VLLHEVKITYPNRKEAISDKTGQRIKEFVLRFLQIQYDLNGRLVQEFLIEDKDFEQLINRKLDVKAYFDVETFFQGIKNVKQGHLP